MAETGRALVSFTEWLQQHQLLIDEIVESVVRRYHLSAAEAAELVARVRQRLSADDCGILRRYSGRSSLQTFLTMLITREHLAFQRELWGTWLPSALARRLGPTAILLEELTARDELAFDEAARLMHTTYGVTEPRAVLEDLMQEITIARAFGAEDACAPGEVPIGQVAGGLGSRVERVEAALADALRLLSPEDQLLLSMAHLDRAPLSGIARLLGLEARPSRRRLERATEVVRSALLTQGIAAEDVEIVLGRAPSAESEVLRLRWWKSALPRPSH